MAMVLVVDDERPILDLLVEIVEDVGHLALSARDGAAALLLAQRYQPDLIISDVMMPELDGHGLVAAVRADPALAHIQVLLISASFPQQRIPVGTVPQCLPKPLDLTLVEQVLTRLL